MLGFTIKKWLGALMQPLPVLLILLIISLILMVRGKSRAAISVQSLCIVLLIVISTPPLSNLSIKAIEGDAHQIDSSLAFDYIVVLGCGHINDRRVPITAQVEACSLYRVAEGVGLLQNHPSAKLVFSGYGANQPLSNAETNKELATALGVPEHRILTYSTPKDTKEEAQMLAPILKGKPFALVTEASHMNRALIYFQQQGLSPIPAPTGHLYRDEGTKLLREYLPSSHNVQKFERATYELLGQLWQRITA